MNTREKISYITGNRFKFQIAEKIFEKIGLSPIYLLIQENSHDFQEIQARTSQEVAIQKAKEAFTRFKTSCIVSDTSFHIPFLNGFPGPYVKDINHWLKAYQILNLLEGAEAVVAYFEDVRVYINDNGQIFTFTCRTDGRIDPSVIADPLGGVDNIFIPDNHNLPLASLNSEEQLTVWDESGWISLKKHLLCTKRT